MTIGTSVFTGNQAHREGGSLHFELLKELLIQSSTFASNVASFWGGALSLHHPERVRVAACHFADNKVIRMGGAALSIRYPLFATHNMRSKNIRIQKATVKIDTTYFKKNKCDSAGDCSGGAIWAVKCAPEVDCVVRDMVVDIRSCSFVQNLAAHYGTHTCMHACSLCMQACTRTCSHARTLMHHHTYGRWGSILSLFWNSHTGLMQVLTEQTDQCSWGGASRGRSIRRLCSVCEYFLRSLHEQQCRSKEQLAA